MSYQMFVRDSGLEQVPIVLLSGVADLLQKNARVGTPYFLRKPFAPDTLSRLVESALAERRPPMPATP